MQTSTDSATAMPSRWPIVASFVTMFLVGVMIALLGPSLPGIAGQTHSDLAQVGVLFTLFAAGSLSATLLMGRLADQPIRHVCLVGGLLLAGTMVWLTSFSQTLAWAGVAMLLAGFGMSCSGVPPTVIISETYGRRAPSAINALYMVSAIGSFLAPLAVGLAIGRGSDYTLVFRLLGTLQILAAGLWAISRPPRPLRHAGASPAPLVLHKLIPLLILALFVMLYVGAEQAIGGWLFVYSGQAAGLSAAGAGAATALFWLALILGRLMVMPVLARVSTTRLLAGCVFLGGAGIGMMLLAPWATAWLWAGIALTGLAFGPVFPTTVATGTQTVPRRMGLASSLLVAASSVGAMILPWAGGALIPRWGVAASLSLACLALALMLLCLWLFIRRRSPVTE